MLGPAYADFAGRFSVAALAGEWAFSRMLFGDRVSTWERYEREVLDLPTWGIPPEDRPQILALRAPRARG